MSAGAVAPGAPAPSGESACPMRPVTASIVLAIIARERSGRMASLMPFKRTRRAASSSSASAIVPVPLAAAARVALVGELNVSTMVSPASSSASPVTVTAMVWLVVPAVKVSVPAGIAV